MRKHKSGPLKIIAAPPTVKPKLAILPFQIIAHLEGKVEWTGVGTGRIADAEASFQKQTDGRGWLGSVGWTLISHHEQGVLPTLHLRTFSPSVPEKYPVSPKRPLNGTKC